MNVNGSSLLRILAFVAFVIAAVLCIVVKVPDVFDVLAAISIGLALWVVSTLAPGP